MIDIHSHILPGLDDGSDSLEESLAMLRVAAESGTTDIVATPHANQRYRYSPGLVEEKVAELRAACGGLIRIHQGTDFNLYYENIEDAVANPTKYTINHTDYLLVEFEDFFLMESAEQIWDQLMGAGMIPIITHPERNGLLQQKIDDLQRWIDRGCLIQVTAQSFLGRFGGRAKNFADELLKRGMVHFVASDAHDPEDRPPKLIDAYQYVARKQSTERAELLFVENPAAVLEGVSLEYEALEAPPESRKWYEFWR